MGLKFVKIKAAAEAQVQEQELEEVKVVDLEAPSKIKSLIDKLAKLTPAAEKIAARIKAEEAKLKDYRDTKAELEKLIQEDDTKGDDEEKIRYEGNEGTLLYIEAGKKSTNREITNMELVRKELGTDTFLKVATVTLKDIDTYVAKKDQEAFITTGRGKRTLKYHTKTA